MTRRAFAGWGLLFATITVPPVLAQSGTGARHAQAAAAGTDIGRTGQRQGRDDTAREAGIAPTARINGRIANRIQLRLRNRIDRNYDPTSNATSPFAIAARRSQTR